MRVLVIYFLFYCYANGHDLGFVGRFENGFQNSSSFFKLKTFEMDSVILNETFTYYLNSTFVNVSNFKLNCRSDYLKVGYLVNWTDIQLPPVTMENSVMKLNFTVFSKRLGSSNIICTIYLPDSNSTKVFEQKIGQLIVLRHPTIAELVFRIIVSIFVIFLTFVMGCGLDRDIILNYLKKPISPFIGFVSQFLFMPLISAALGKLSGIENSFALGLLVIGCSPGGGASNIWTVLYGGDLNLSMTMTFISSCAALGMMPLWLFALGRLFIDPKNVVIPYDSIAINLLQVVLPVGIGIFVRWKWEEKSKVLVKKVKIMGIIFIIFVLSYGTYANLYIYKLIGDYIFLLPIGAFLPWLGFIFGYLLALATRRNKKQAIAIALETGFQNIGIAILILKFSMPQPDGDMGAVMPLIVAMFTPLPLYVGYAALVIKKKCCKSSKQSEDTEMKSNTDEQKNVLLDESPKD
uniref:Slc10a-2 n=1 Tax=Schmidtea mediterranea TaxID=79327 RepID=A0A0H3YJ17_SCHMD|nr:slc10a-2 [Schmidtea mediterranea]